MFKFLVAIMLLSFAVNSNAAIIQFDLEDVTNGGGFFASITIEDTASNTVTVNASIADNPGLTQGDILGLGFDISDGSLLAGMSIANFSPSGTTIGTCFTVNGCDVFTGGTGSLGEDLDIGLSFSVSGAPDFNETISFDLISVGLNALVFGELAVMRVQRIEGVDGFTAGSSKLAGDGETTVVPEPSIIALFAVGLIGIGFARRRKVL
jgi:hypothetical protein